ncbi:MAG: hypothetical protein KA146_04870 [Leptospiraceae bacterium]|nr:hypothetical protein [Leptospiraceae bacterium]
MIILNSVLLAHGGLAESIMFIFLSIPVLAVGLVFLTKIILRKLAPNKFEINTFPRYFLVWILYLILIIGFVFILVEQM